MKIKIIIFMTILGVFSSSVIFSQNNNEISENVRRALRTAGLTVPLRANVPSDFTLPALDGTEFTLSRQKGKVVFLNFWATWCPPCREEMPSMESLYQKLKDKGLEIIAVNLQESGNNVAAFMNRSYLSFPALLDARGTVGSMYNVRAIPTSYIIDKRGLIVAQLVGSTNWDTPNMVAAFEALLAE